MNTLSFSSGGGINKKQASLHKMEERLENSICETNEAKIVELAGAGQKALHEYT